MSDIPLAYDDTGGTATDVVLFVHGFPHGRAFWSRQLLGVSALAPGWRGIAPDLRGFGDSDARGPYSMDRYADDLAALLDRLGVERAAVVGLSMGGYVAFAFWRRHASRVRALVLADTRAGADTPDARARRDELITLARTQGSAAVADSQLASALGASTRATRPEIVAELRALMARAPVAGVIGALEAMRDRPDSTPTLATIAVPTLVIVGAEDAITRPSDARALCDGIPGARLTVLADAGHVSSLEQPDRFNAAVASLLTSLMTA